MLAVMLRRLATLLLGLWLPASARAAPLSLPVQQSAAPDSFVPSGWSTELALDGDLDADGAADRVLVLLQQEASAKGERERALLVLFKREAGYVVGATNLGLLSCYECLGVKGGDGRPELTIQRGVLVVAQLGGSRYWYSATHRFRWHTKNRKLELIGLDGAHGDAATGRVNGDEHQPADGQGRDRGAAGSGRQRDA